MIFVTLGSQKFQFNRLLKMIDNLIDQGIIKEEVFAQTGYSNYTPQRYKSRQFLDRDEFIEKMENSHLIVTHAGTGAIITALKKEKKVIAIPRLKEFQEHVDDHQVQIVNEFVDLNFIMKAENEEELVRAFTLINNKTFNKYESSTKKIMDSLDDFIQKI